jgi:hypothetical protein
VTLRQRAFMILTAIAAAMCIVYLQQRFDAGDVKNAVSLARSYRAQSGWTLPEVLEARHPKSQVDWRGSEQSSCFQHVRVDAWVTPAGGGLPLDYAFSIDINGPSIHPDNPLGQEAIAALDAPRPTGDRAP